ncbi:hypothetical protein Mapa_002293 [Marchantia paleacea]|nr:hypothetical protein Mapa_002293 [Marchantia paleacea]
MSHGGKTWRYLHARNTAPIGLGLGLPLALATEYSSLETGLNGHDLGALGCGGSAGCDRGHHSGRCDDGGHVCREKATLTALPYGYEG